MSSNLVKQNYVITQSEETRIINYNGLLEEKLKAFLQTQDTAESQDGEANGFTEGLPIADTVAAPEPEEEKDYVAEAQAEAEKILAEAREQADALIAEAREQAHTLCEEQKEKGYRDGQSRMESEIASFKQQLKQELEQKEAALNADYEMQFSTMEADLIDAIIQVFDRVFHIQFEQKRDILLYLVSQTIRQTESGNVFRIRVSLDNRNYLEEHMEDILAQIGRNATLEIVGDVACSDGDCRIEAESGVFDCGVDIQFSNLIKDIRSLCV